ncbi:MAG TPA: hypothetical protein VM737_08040 [Gemmatimonadota bacterium]|nr:hypothetical protein [Gemmatimonadota bacterium]
MARDLPAENGRLLAAFPGRPAYRYRPGEFEPLPAANLPAMR